MKNLKRLIAMVLVLCSLMSFVPSMAVAVGNGEGSGDPVIVTYDFELEKTTLTTTSGGSFANGGLVGAAISGAVAGYYDSGELNWKYDSNNHQSFKNDSTTVSEMIYFGGNGSGNAWSGLRVGVKVVGHPDGDYPIGHWMALNIKVPTAGKYDLMLNHQFRADGTTAAKIYLLEGTYADNAAIEAAMTANNLQATVDFSSKSWSYTEGQASLGEAELKAGEYTIVFHATADRTDGAGCYFYLRNLVAELKEATQIEPLTNVSYDFSQQNITDLAGKSFKNKYFYNNIPDADIAALYAAGTLNWNVVASNYASFVGGDVTKADSYLSYGDMAANWTGLRLAMRVKQTGVSPDPYKPGHWFAFNLKGPGAGTYEATLNYQTRSDGNRDVKVYLIPGALTDAAAIQTAIDSATSLTSGFEGHKDATGATGNYLAGVKDLGDVTLVDGDYTLVIHCASETGTYFFLNGLELNEKAAQEETTGATVGETTSGATTEATTEETTVAGGNEDVPVGYTFDLHSTDLVNTAGNKFGATSMRNNAAKDAVSAYYDQGTISWKYALDNISTFNTFEEGTNTPVNKASDTFFFGDNTTGSYPWSSLRLGLKVVTPDVPKGMYPAGYWAAFTVKAPGTGNYKISLDYQVRRDGTPEGEVYILPGTYTDVAQLNALLTRDNMRQVIDFRNTKFGLAEDAANPADLGIMNLTEQEYTFVFRANKVDNGAYIYLNELIFEATTEEPYVPELPEEEIPVVEEPVDHSFQLGASNLTNLNGGSFGGATLTDAVNLDKLNAYYDEDMISWKYALDNISTMATETQTAGNTFYFGGGNGYAWAGLRLGVRLTDKTDPNKKDYPAGWWAAFTVKAPGSGTYATTLKYQTRGDGTPEGEVYLIKGTFTDRAELEAQMTKDNLLKVIDFSATKDFTDASRELGIVDYSADEYTIVFKSAAKKTGAGGAYAYINGLEFKKSEPKVELPPVQADSLKYDFELGHSKLTLLDGSEFNGKTLDSNLVVETLGEYFTDQKIYWKYSLDNLDSFKTETNSVGSTYYIGNYVGPTTTYAWDGIRLGVRITENGKSRYPAGWWTALTIHSPGKGNYQFTLNLQHRADVTTRGEIYLIKGSFTDPAQLEKAMTRDNLRQVVDTRSNTLDFSAPESYDLGVMAMEQGEYTLVFKAAKASAGGAYLYINSMEAKKTSKAPYVPELPAEEKPVVVTPQYYNFELNASPLRDLNGAEMGGGILTDSKIMDALKKYYDEGMISWKYATDNLNTFAKNGVKVGNTYYIGGTDTYKWDGIRFGMVTTQPDGTKSYSTPGWWTAFTIKSPGKGTHYLHLDFQKRSDAAVRAEVYLIKGKLTDMKAVEAQMTKANLLKELEMKTKTAEFKDASEYLGPVSMDAGEYTLVIKCLEGNPAGAYIYMNGLTFDKNPPPEPTEITYNFDLNNKEDGIYTGKAIFWDKTDDLAQRYANGKLNWKYETKADSFDGGANAFNAAYGMVMYTSEENWMAFRIKSPGAGLYTMILNHAKSARGALGAMYVLPGDTKDIEGAMDHGNRVGKIQFYNDDGDVAVKNGYTTTMGTYEFEKNKEYIVVFEAYDNTPYQRSIAYMWISQLIAKKGDHTVSAVGNRQIKSMVVDAEACPTMEPTVALVAAEIDGQDYLFMPTEGRALYIFNLEDNVMVRKVTGTPFPICRGITVDKEGIIWAVGDAQVLWRYDFRTNTGWTSYNYKFNGVPNAGCGYQMTTDDAGNIYWGVNPSACIAKYDPQANKFSVVGGNLDPVDGDYGNVPIIKDGYLYATVAGDKSNDGVKTAWVVKIDLETEKIVDRLDITKQFGDKEVMVRGGGICGNTLFYGGISMADYVAIDLTTEKMQLKTYDVLYGQISYSPTEEIDGKCYMVVGGKMFKYDGVTDTMERVYGMDLANVGFKPTGHSSITLSNNPLFPGISYVTQTGTGIKYYNMETLQVTTPYLYDEDKEGSGQLVRCIISGEPGDNNIYIGGYNTDTCAIISTDTGLTSHFKATSSQTDVMLWYEGTLYVGNYNAANVVRINFEDKDKNVILKSFKSQYHQARVHALAAGDGKLFAGTIPDSFLFGGCVSITDLETLQTHVEHNLIEGQIATSLAYNDGILFGATSTSGGTGASRPEEEKPSAVIFAYDVENKKLLATLDLRKNFPQLPSRLDYIDGIQADPNIAQNGKIWGMVGEVLFNFTYDKETNKFDVDEVLTYGYTQPSNISRGWDAIPFAFDGNGNIYACFHSTGGLRRVNIENPADNERINVEIPKTFCLGNDGNLYYGIGTSEVKMYPLNVSEEDWKMAEGVDKLINAIGKVSLDSESAIVAAREAYNALGVGHRALVQLYDKLLEAETDLLECKIDALPEEITLEQEELINGLLATYEAMPLKEQKYVKNYQVLNAASMELQKLVNEREAKAYQKLLDETLAKLGEITLEDESQIRALREAYDKLIFAQRQLVDAKGLFDAEAKIKAIRQVRIDRLIELIGKIGNPVTLADEAVINEAMEIYEWLYMDEREQVDYTTLVAAQKTLQKLQKAAAAEVDELIALIGDSVDYSSGAAIKAAREAYDALTEGSKQYVKLYDILVEAEAIYNSLFPIWAIIVIAVVAVGCAATAVVVVLKKRKGNKTPAAVTETPADPQE